jgi:pimeloyl-ACP methyl ester carboxylesterase
VTIPAIGDDFGRFRVLAKAGEGGMGVVLKAEDTQLGRLVALKFLTGLGRTDSAAAQRVLLEARSLAALNHPNIVAIHDIGELDGVPYLVLEWVAGLAVGQAASARPWSETDFLRVALPIAEALAAAHSSQIVHRDIKPGNVLLTADGVVKLVDFGLVKFRDQALELTKPATILGTPAYMSPEQATGGEVGPPSDVFSFGVLAYELLTGARPFAGDSYTAVLFSIVHAPHAPLAERRPDLSPGLIEVVERCLRKEETERYATGAELTLDLHRAVRSRGEAETRMLPGSSTRPAATASKGPEIRYCRTADGASIAYAVHGSGPLLVRVLGWFTHLEMEWEWPAMRHIWERLARTHTVVRYDGRGIGLSSPWDAEFTETTRQLDLDAVLDAVGAASTVLYGISEGGWTAAYYALRRPERVARLVIYGGYSRGATFRPGYDPDEARALLTLMRKGWGRDTPEIRQIFTTAYFGTDADPALVAHFNRLQRAAADGDTAARYQESLDLRGDARDDLARLGTATLVMHCRDDRIIPFEEGRLLASVIPGAEFLPLPSATHYFPLDDELSDRMVDAIDRFTAPRGGASPSADARG